ncbi:hypothetical protein B0H67DRAFT_589123 [Lasiosphaeris hirsuta]|uniref:RBR-type E3 ubiquitin transferase n=1 Tax=Lasiosphaeris hirsuta TaxID=260670 RepID=A0AA40A2E9_9PEZI|nr:hypothetical protein B0H67DRAFT_589123 [Lasiosphaeris hirsuta]
MDLLILTDATASMTTYLRSLNQSLQDIIRISSLTGCFSRIGVMAYRDYYKGKLTEWSGWHSRDSESDIDQDGLLSFARGLSASHGGDWPEATKTGLAHCYQVMRGDAKTIILLYTDAPPHTPNTGGTYHDAEQTRLKLGTHYGSSTTSFADWALATRMLRDGGKQAQVFAVVQPGGYHNVETLSLYTFLCEVTGGACLHLKSSPSSESISQLTVALLMAWMGVEKEGAKLDSQEVAERVAYKDKSAIDLVVSENSSSATLYFLASAGHSGTQQFRDNLEYVSLTMENMAQLIPHRENRVADFSQRYTTDTTGSYRNLVVAQIGELIDADVAAIALNPVFGTLWRAICNDRLNPMRDDLIASFSLRVSQISDEEKKKRMAAWLEESYDRAGEITAVLNSIPDDAMFPCVFLDPTLDFGKEQAGAEGGVPSQLTRDELLEIGRSCDPRVLGRLGRVLTRLTYVKSEKDMPLHIKGIPSDQVPRIPMALARPKHKRMFWRLLLHCVIPGTMLSFRPAALLAALSVRMGIRPLGDVAYAELLAWKDKWNNLEIPETWNTSCLSLILEADSKVQALLPSKEAVLGEADRKLFKTLIDYKLLEANLDTTLTAKVGWRPEKTEMPLGPVVICRRCQYPRSVTVMGKGGICGMCDLAQWRGCEKEQEAAVHVRASKNDNEASIATWFECYVADCRAQYIVYWLEHLKVRPKCHYCREGGQKAPCVECTECLSRVIWPEEYRPADFSEKEFRCVGCTSNMSTIIENETAARKLSAENGGIDWLLRNSDEKISKPLSGCSLFKMLSAASLDEFANKVEVFPCIEGPELRIKGKLVRNVADLIGCLRGWVESRRVENGTCSLCIESFRKSSLRPGCLRQGCKEVICGDCCSSWYGINKRGSVINTAALNCPFCRRRPSTRATALPREVKTLGGLRDAVAEEGSWIYGWCDKCGLAKRFLERVCAVGAPAEVNSWICEDCQSASAGELSSIKECPGCKTKTEKMGGCHHMACSVPNCGAHWCWKCGEQVEEELIYVHITTAHGGLYDEEEEEEEDEEEQEGDWEEWLEA